MLLSTSSGRCPRPVRPGAMSRLSLILLAAALCACEEGPPPEPGSATAADVGAPLPDGRVPEPGSAAEVRVVGEPLALEVGEATGLRAEIRGPDGEALARDPIWRSDAPLVARIDAGGIVLGVSPGEARLRAEVGGVVSAPLGVTVRTGAAVGPPWSTVIEPLLRARCATAGCHVDGVEPGDLRFDRQPGRVWEELIEDRAEQTGGRRVAPGDPGGSYLVAKLVLDRPEAGGRMPLGRPPLPTGDLQLIVAWIAAGAAR